MKNIITEITNDTLNEIRKDKNLIGRADKTEIIISYFQYENINYFSITNTYDKKDSYMREDTARTCEWAKSNLINLYPNNIMWTLELDAGLTEEEIELYDVKTPTPWRDEQ